MEITPDHPVYVEGKGWLWAENLFIGDRLRRADGGIAKVLAVERVKLAEPELVYNFTVKGPHTYFVLEVGVLVHNASCNNFDDVRRDLGIERPIQEAHAQRILEHPAIVQAINTGDLSTLRKLLNIPEKGKLNILKTQITDLWNKRSMDPSLYEQATLEKVGENIYGRWQRGSGQGPNPQIGNGSWHLGDELVPLENNSYMYIIDAENNIRYVPIPLPGDRYIVHTQLAGGQKVLGAGEFRVENGVIIRINTASGHYQPSPEYIAYAKGVFTEKGLVTSETKFIASRPERTQWERTKELIKFIPEQTRRMIREVLK
jgi:hypothetical protein